MRILTVLTTLGVGGAERQALRIAEGMAARGNEVLLLVLLPPQRNQWPTSLRTIHLDLKTSPVLLLQSLFRARKLVSGLRPHIVHSHTYPANIFARLLKFAGCRFKLIATIHNIYEGGRLRMLVYRLTDFLADRITAVSTASAERYIQLGAVPAEKIHVLTNGIDVDEFSPTRFSASVEREQFIWLAAGRVAPAKDFSNLLRAFAIVRESAPQTHLRIAGEPVAAESQRLHALAAELGISDCITWLGPRNDLPQLMADADAFVLSSAWEGMPLVVGEAMAMGLPVVATDVGGVRELTGECASIVPAKDPAALAGAMFAVQKMTEQERVALGAAARIRIVEKFNVSTKLKVWAALYVDLLFNYKQPSLRAPLIAASLIRLTLLFTVLMRTGISAITSGDTFSYFTPGANLLQCGRYFNIHGPELDRTPGYPLFLALASQFGFVFAVLMQLALSVATIWLAVRIAAAVFATHQQRHNIARAAAWLMVFEPLSLAYSLKLYPEALFLFFFLLALDQLIRALSRRHLFHLALATIALATATYVKPITLYLPLFIAVALVIFFRRTARVRWQSPLLVLALSIALIAPWQLRNQHSAGFNGFTAVQQKNLYFFQAAGVIAQVEHRPFAEVQRELGYSGNSTSSDKQSELINYEGRKAARILIAHPFAAVSLQLKGAVIVALTPGVSDLFALLGANPNSAPARLPAQNSAAAAIQFALTNPVHALVMIGFAAFLLWLYWHAFTALRSTQLSTQIGTLFILIAAYILLLSGGAQAVGRYRLPIMPLVCVLAAGTVAGRRLHSVERGFDGQLNAENN